MVVMVREIVWPWSFNVPVHDVQKMLLKCEQMVFSMLT